MTNQERYEVYNKAKVFNEGLHSAMSMLELDFEDNVAEHGTHFGYTDFKDYLNNMDNVTLIFTLSNYYI